MVNFDNVSISWSNEIEHLINRINPIAQISREPTIDKIEYVTCRYYNTTPEKISIKSKKRSIVIKRQVIMFLSRKVGKRSYGEISKYYNKNHSTAIYAEKTIKNLMSVDRKLNKEINHLIDILQ